MPTELTNYQCPSCTGPLHYDGHSGKLTCDYCGNAYTPEEMEAIYLAQGQPEEPPEAAEPPDREEDWTPDNLQAYSCPSCGAQLLCEATTAATSCPYCGNPAIVPGRLSGSLKPDYIIPFRLDKAAAMAALRKHYTHKPLLPKAFSGENHICQVQGVYVPFWLFDGEASGSMVFHATRSRTRRAGDTEITTTDHFTLHRAGHMAFARIPADGSSKLPDGHMNAIEPFDYGQMVDFSQAYLPGFLAHRYDVPARDASAAVRSRMTGSLAGALAATAMGYQTCMPVGQQLRARQTKVSYALLPVWLLHTRWKDKDYLFAMNGQTGKLIGDLPVSWGRFWAWFGGIFGGVTAAVFLILLLLF